MPLSLKSSLRQVGLYSLQGRDNPTDALSSTRRSRRSRGSHPIAIRSGIASVDLTIRPVRLSGFTIRLSKTIFLRGRRQVSSSTRERQGGG